MLGGICPFDVKDERDILQAWDRNPTELSNDRELFEGIFR